MKEDKTLPVRQERFCQEFILDLNATRAARDSGYSRKTACEQASRLLANVKIQQRIQELMEERAERLKLSQDMIVDELKIVAFSDLADYVDVVEDTGAIRAKSFAEMKKYKSRALKRIKEDRAIKEDASGEQVTVYDKVCFELHDKLRALELLGKHIGMFADEMKIKSVSYQALSIEDFKNSMKILNGEKKK